MAVTCAAVFFYRYYVVCRAMALNFFIYNLFRISFSFGLIGDPIRVGKTRRYLNLFKSVQYTTNADIINFNFIYREIIFLHN